MFFTWGPVEEDVTEAASDDVELVTDDCDSGVKFRSRHLSFDTPNVTCDVVGVDVDD